MKTGKKTQVKPWKDPETGYFATGNPGGPGRPAGVRNFTTKVKEALEKIADGDATPRDVQLAEKIVQMALAGNEQMIKELWQQIDGKPLQRVGNPDGSNIMPIPILYVQNDNSDKEDNGDEEENTSGSGRNECEQDDIDSIISNTPSSER